MLKRFNFYLIILVLFGLVSCGSSRYRISFTNGKSLDFNQGKWLLDSAQTNSNKFKGAFYNAALSEYRKILGDSLVEIWQIRSSKMIPNTIPFELKKSELIELGKMSECEYLITLKGEILTNNAGSLNVPFDGPYYYATNESFVQIMVYDFVNGMEISSSSIHAKIVNENSHFGTENDIPTLNLSAQSAMLKSTKKLIRKYSKHSL